MDIFRKRFKASKCKTLLKLVVSRIKIGRNKHELQLRQLRTDVFQLLQNKQEDSALIRVENVIREQNIVDAFNVIEIYCDLVTTRMSIIDAQKVCPPDLQEAVSSLLYAGPRCAELPELLKVRKLFVRKYGQDFVTAAIELHSNCGVSNKIIEKLSGRSPSLETKENLLKKIALENGLQWEPSSLKSEPFKSHNDTPVSYSVGDSKASSPRLSAEAPKSLPVKSPKSDHAQVTPKTQRAPPPTNVDDSSSRRHSVFNGSTYPEKPTTSNSDEHDEAPYIRQFVPFVSTDPSTLSESGDVKRKQVVPSPEKTTLWNSKDSGKPTMLTAQQKTGNYTADRDSRVTRQHPPNQNHVDELYADGEEPQLSKSSYYKAVAAAAEAAAISAESAAAAARTAAKLAHSGFSRENSIVSDDEEDFKHATTTPIQEKAQNAGFKKDMNKTGGKRNLDGRSSQPTEPRASATLKTNVEKGNMTETSNEDDDDDVDAPNYLEGKRYQTRAVLDQTSSDSEQELEHNQIYNIYSKPAEKSALKSNNPVSDEYNYRQSSSAEKKVYAASSNKEALQDKFSWNDDIDHGRANRQHSEPKPGGLRPKPEESLQRNERNNILSMSLNGEHEENPFSGRQVQRLDSEISRPIFDEAFRHKSLQQMEEFHGTKKLEKHETTWEDDEDEDTIWSEQNIQNFSNQKKASVPTALRPRAVESLEAETDSEIDEESSARISATAFPRSYETFTAPQTSFLADYASDESGSPMFHENGSKARFDKPLYDQNQMGRSNFQEAPHKSYDENLTSYKKDLFNGQAAKQNLASEFQRREISSHSPGGQKKHGSVTWESDYSEREDYSSNYSSATQYVRSSDSKAQAISPVSDENVMDHFDITDVKKPSNLPSRPRIGASVRSRRMR